MPLAITLGYRSKGRTAEPEVLYCGLDAGAADSASLNPPVGFVRTEMFKFPTPTRRREYPDNVAPLVDEEQVIRDFEKAAAEKAAAEKAAAEKAAAEKAAAEKASGPTTDSVGEQESPKPPKSGGSK